MRKRRSFIFLSLCCPLSLSSSSLPSRFLSLFLSLSLSLRLRFPCPYSGRPLSLINSHHHPQVRFRRVNHSISESELNSMSKYDGWIMKSNQRVRVLPGGKGDFIRREIYFNAGWVRVIIRKILITINAIIFCAGARLNYRGYARNVAVIVFSVATRHD